MAKAKKISKANHSLWLAIVFMIFGVCLMFGGFGAAHNVLGITFTVMGIVLIVLGVLNAVIGMIPFAVAELLLGVLMIVFAWTLTWVAFLVIGVYLFIVGIAGLMNKRGNQLVNIIDFVIGLLLILNAVGYNIHTDMAWVAVALNVVTIVAGALLFVDGLLLLIGSKK